MLGAVVIVMWDMVPVAHSIYLRSQTQAVPLSDFVPASKSSALRGAWHRCFSLTSDAQATPPALLHNLKHNHVLHEHINTLTKLH
jgi:KUP system potassium uptake protein